MIRQISIQNIAIAERLEVDFGPRLNIITGETGAGKSLLVDALSLLRGSRADVSLVRTGSDAAQVAGVFSLPDRSPVHALLGELGLGSEGDELILRRVVQKNGKNRAYVNDTPVSLRTLQAVAEELIDISSQFENQRLLNPDTHTRYLDSYAGTHLQAEALRRGFEEAQRLRRDIDGARKERDLRRRQKDLCAFELTEISEADLSVSEFARTEEVLLLARKTSAAHGLCKEALEALVEDESSCVAQLRLARKNLEKLQRMSEGTRCAVDLGAASAAAAAVEDLATQFEKVQRAFAVDEEAVARAEERIEVYNKLLRKFGPGLDDVFRHAEECREFLRSSDNLDADLERMAKSLADLASHLLTEAHVLSEKRISAVTGLCRAIERELADLGMPKARFVCNLVSEAARQEPLPAETVALLTSEAVERFSSLGKFGFERARFLLSANPGMEPQAIERVASGGELSRVMLAIKTVLFSDETVNLFVFDEIDTGISGQVAAKVGRKLAHFCERHQAICITHLPQVACHAQTHFVARKRIERNQTSAEISRIDKKERVGELARLLSGEKVVPESLAQAKALLAEATGARA